MSAAPPTWMPVRTDDGSYTFYSETFQETFHSREGARQEAEQKYVQQLQIGTWAAQRSPLRILDVCYGLGYNTAAALESVLAAGDGRLQWLGLELDPTVPQAVVSSELIEEWSPPVQQMLRDLAQTGCHDSDRFQGQLLWGDARQTIQEAIAQNFQADAIFLDPFSPKRCPQLWTVEFLQLVARCLAPQGRLVTYCRAAAVRTALQLAGLQITNLPAPASAFAHRWSLGTIAAWEPLPPLSQAEQEHLHCRAAVPYRDPTLQDTAEVIRQRRDREQQQSKLESTSAWRRRWGLQAGNDS
ncbi:tRNA (5-methylaminomethyl-2-thiouridine)(34)-methyltransferase MnmD [Synechococcus elongatus]|uniref:tRNA (5-methylaminomethyl-2-thiouridine)(34)-methyltransferase MnmD n=1 Tax=Synechococcus elongatus TaxID=32046 RepID=UPI000F7F3C9D|nr:MnmC family methyltransferase [Synechococcus elongatus]